MYLAFCFGAELPKEKSLVLYHFWLVSAVVSFSKVFVGSVGIAALALVVPACPLADRSAEEVCKSCKPCHLVHFSEIKWLFRYLTNAQKAPRLWRDSVVLSSDNFLSLFLLLSDKKRRFETVSARIVAMSASDRPKRDWAEDPRPGGQQRAHKQTCGSGVEAREHPNRLQPPSSGNTSLPSDRPLA